MPRKSPIPKRGWNKRSTPEAHQAADGLPQGAARGRGAGLNPGNRFETVRLSILGEFRDHDRAERIAESGGDASATDIALPQAKVETVLLDDHTRTIINPVDSPDLPFLWTVNPYRGCEHGCVYCYARPTHENLGMSSGLDFETRIVVKRDAAALLARELDHPRWKGEPIVMSGVTDAYQPVERDLGITRACLAACAERGQPVSVITKNRLVTRDIDHLVRLATLPTGCAARVAISLTTLDASLARSMEPRASSPRERLRAMRELSDAGVPVAVMTAPILPGLTDHELPQLLEAAADHGATSAGYVLLRLPWQNKDLVLEWLRRDYPGRAGAVESFIREASGGALYDARFGMRQKGSGPRAEQIRSTFELFTRRYNLATPRETLSSAGFRPRGGQPTLFDMR